MPLAEQLSLSLVVNGGALTRRRQPLWDVLRDDLRLTVCDLRLCVANTPPALEDARAFQ